MPSCFLVLVTVQFASEFPKLLPIRLFSRQQISGDSLSGLSCLALVEGLLLDKSESDKYL